MGRRTLPAGDAASTEAPTIAPDPRQGNSPPPAGFVPGYYAYGLDHHSEGGRRVVGHDGSIAGFDSVMQSYVDDGLTIIVLTNTNGAAHPMAAKIAKILIP